MIHGIDSSFTVLPVNENSKIAIAITTYSRPFKEKYYNNIEKQIAQYYYDPPAYDGHNALIAVVWLSVCLSLCLSRVWP